MRVDRQPRELGRGARRARGTAFATCSSPPNLEQGKVVTTAVYGGNVVAIDGNYDDVNRLCAELAGMYEWAFVNVNMRPYYAEGSKTLAFETAEQLGWQAPDHVVVPVASGSLLTKIQKGFHELHKVGLLDEEPTGPRVGRAGAGLLAGRDAPGSNDSDTIRPVKPDTIAKSLAIGNPADGYFALDAVRTSDGGFAAVTDDEVVDGMRLLARTEGIFAETAGGVTIATLQKLAADGVIRPDERVVVVHHRPRPEDARSGRTDDRPDRDDHTDPRRVPRSVRPRLDQEDCRTSWQSRCASRRSCATLSGDAAEVQVEGTTVGDVLKGLDAQHPGFARAAVRRERRTAPIRQRVRRRRGHPLPAEPRHAGRATRRSSASSPRSRAAA